jgi:hypothetical protein
MKVNEIPGYKDQIDSCPHCGVRHVQVSVGAVAQWSDDATCFLASCQNLQCGKSVFYIRKNRKNEQTKKPIGFNLGDAVFLYPFAGCEALDASILPAGVPEEFTECVTCSVVGASLSSMTMARRVLQRCLKDKGHLQHILAQQIDAAKADGTIPKRYHEIADEIRIYGNIGAHPDDDKMSCVTTENCRHLIEFTRMMIEELYILPQKAALLRKNRTGN